MPKPLAICIEDLGTRDEGRRYLRCVAVVGRRPGLRVTGAGAVIWKSDDAVACELWVSQDQRLILYRPERAAQVQPHLRHMLVARHPISPSRMSTARPSASATTWATR